MKLHEMLMVLVSLLVLSCNLSESLSYARGGNSRRGKCHVNGNTYSVDEEFFPDCDLRCTCHRDGGYGCTPLCPLSRVMCPEGQDVVMVNKPVSGTDNCTCPHGTCERVRDPDCQYLDKTYSVGETFIPDDCIGHCKCGSKGIGCNSLCPPMQIQCKPGEIMEDEQVPIEGAQHCFCDVPKCRKKVHHCVHNGKFHMIGESFVSSDCRGYCRCSKGGRIGCVPVCPLVHISCKPGQRIYHETRLVSSANCPCLFPVCVNHDGDLFSSFTGGK